MAAGTPGIINWQVSPVGTATVKPASDPVMLPVAVSDSWPTIAVSSGYQIKNYSLNGKDYTEAELKALTLSESNATNYEVSTGEYLFTIIVNIVSAGEKKYVSDKGLEHFYENLKKGCPFPIGYGGFFQIDPNSIYAGTTWEQKKGVFILAAGETYPAGSTGGEAQHTLTQAEIPNYKIGDIPEVVPSGHNNWNNGGVSGTDLGTASTSKPGVYDNEGTLTTTGGNQFGYSVSTFGGSQPHNNMPPFYSMPFWIRTA